jgi:hypothetical protein
MMGFIPTGVGLAYLIYYFVEGRHIDKPGAKDESAQTQSPTGQFSQ